METNQPLTEQQCSALFADVAKTESPAEPAVASLGDRLAPYRQTLLDHRAKGYTTEQLVRFLAHPKIAIKTSPSFIRKFLSPSGGGTKHTRRKNKTKPGLVLFGGSPTAPAPAPSKPASV